MDDCNLDAKSQYLQHNFFTRNDKYNITVRLTFGVDDTIPQFTISVEQIGDTKYHIYIFTYLVRARNP